MWFAWLYSRERALWRALIAHVLRKMQAFLLDEGRLARVGPTRKPPLPGHRSGERITHAPTRTDPRNAGRFLPARTGLELWRRQARRQNADVSHLQEIIADVEASYALTHRAPRIVALTISRREFEELSKAVYPTQADGGLHR